MPSPRFAVMVMVAAAGWVAPLQAQFPAQGDTARVRLMLELHRRAETDPPLRRQFLEALLRAEAILPSLQYYYNARIWLTQDSADAQKRREVARVNRLSLESRLLDDKIGAAAARPALLRAADSARAANAANAAEIDARLYATSVTLWQALLPDSVFSTAVLKQRLAAVELRTQEATIRAMAAADRRAATAQLVGQPAGYQGEKANGQPEGHGIRTNSVGDRYEGAFHNGVGNGHGVLDAVNGTRFEGQFVDGVGTGVLTVDLPSGTRYVGVMKSGRRDGDGSMDLPTGERYVGRFREDLFEGRGVLEYADGGRYEGEWRQGKRHGHGTEEYPNGRVLRGLFENDRFVQTEEIQPMVALAPEAPRKDEPEPLPAPEPPPPAAVQAPAPSVQGLRTVSIAGRIMDEANKKALAGAMIYLNRFPQQELSDKDGRFVVTNEAPVELIVRRVGYVPFSTTVEPDHSNVGDVLLHPVRTDADRKALEAMDVKIYPQLAAFYQRRAEFRRGAFFTPDDLARAAGTIPDLLRPRPGFKNICVMNRRDEWDCGKADRGPTTIMGSGQSSFARENECTVRVWTDDVGPEKTLDDVRLDELLAVEAYPTPNDTPKGLGTSQCASVRLWTKRAAQR
jgi:hypothetical protein